MTQVEPTSKEVREMEDMPQDPVSVVPNPYKVDEPEETKEEEPVKVEAPSLDSLPVCA